MKAEEKTVERAVREAMNRRLSGLQSSPVLDAQIRRRIAQEEEPKMKKKLPVVLVFALVLVSLGAVARAAGLIFSPRVTAVALADQALEDTYGITLRMQSFFERTDETQPDGSVRVVYTGSESFRHVLGTYTAEVRNGKASVTWSLDGESKTSECRAGEPDSMLTAVFQVFAVPVDLVRQDPLRIVTGPCMVVLDRSDQNITFVVCIERLLLDPGHAVIVDAHIEFCSELRWVLGFTSDDRPDVWLTDTHDPVCYLVSPVAVHVVLLFIDLSNHVQSDSMCRTQFFALSQEPVDVSKITPDILELLFQCLTDRLLRTFLFLG